MKKNLFIWFLLLFIAGTLTAQNTKTNSQLNGEKGKLLVFEGSETGGNQIIETGKYIDPQIYNYEQIGYDSRSPKAMLLSPTGDGGFENGTTPATNNWTAVNSTTDSWVVGSGTPPSAGSKCGYISSTNGATWTYSQLSVIQHIFYDVTIPANEPKLTLTFKWKVGGEGSGTNDWDNMKVFWGLASEITPLANTAVATSYQVSGPGSTNGMYKLNSTTWNSETFSFLGTPGQTYRLVFSWKSDISDIVNPPAAIDEISLTSGPLGNITSTAFGGHWSSPATWVGGIVPSSDIVTIAAGATVVVNQSVIVNDLTIDGNLQWLTTTAPSSTVNTLQANNITINSGGILLAHGAITAGSAVRVTGNFTNNGTANFGAASALLQFNGTGGTQTLGGSGTFIADTEGRGMIRQLFFTTLAACNISTTQNIVTGNLALTGGSLNTNGKLHIDNTAISFGGLINRSVYSVVVNNMGSGYTSAPTVAFTAAPAGGTTATGVANLDAATGTIRSITITNPGNGYRVAPIITFSGGVGTGAAAVATVYQSLSATTIAQSQKSAVANITGGITINNNQGVGSIFVTNGGTGYTSAPTVGFALPVSFTNLVINGGSGYTSAPTVSFTGGGGTGATATAVVSRGKVVSVHITAGGSNYTSTPTISFTGGGGSGATASIPAGMLPTATAIIDPALGMITGFTVTNPGYGYLTTFPGVTLTGGNGTGAAGATSRHGIYNLIYAWFLPAATNAIHTESAVIPANRRIHALTIASATGFGASFNNNLTLFGAAPIFQTTGASPTAGFTGEINLGGNSLSFEHPSYTGFAGSSTAYISNGSINYKLLGLTTSQTRPFPFNTYDGTVNNLVTMGASTTVATTGSTITSITGSIAGAPSGTDMIGTRTLRLQTNGQWGNDPTVRLTWNSVDNLVASATGLTIAQAVAPSGPWTIRSISSGTGNINPAGGNRTTATSGVGPIVPTGDDYFGWNFFVAPPCSVPGAQPTNLTLIPASTSISGSYTAATGAAGHLVLLSTSPTLVTLPQNNTSYSSGNAIGTATVVYAGTNTTTFSTSGLAAFSPYYFFVFAYNAGESCTGPVYRTVSPLTGSATTLPAAPASFTALPLGPTQIGFTATANSLGHNIMIAFSTVSATAFGTPTALYPIGSTIPGGGVVHYVGPANEAYNHNNLTENTTYHYRAWTIVPGPIYSSASLLSTVKTPCSPYTQLPWNEGFEGVDLGASTSSTTLFPTCWTKQNGDWATAKNSNTTYDADARSGAQFLTNSWSAINEFMWTPGFALQSGMSYDFSFWWAGDDYAGWTGDVFYSSTPNGTGATQLGASFVTPLITTTKTYAKVTRTFAPVTTGTYYFAIRVNATSAPWYLNFDDFELRVTPTAPIFVVTPLQADFGSQSIFTPSVPQVFTLYNDGIGTISISSIAVAGTNANQFVLQPHQALPILLGPAQVATVSVTFAPSTAGPKTAQLVITDNLSSKAVRSLPLTGVGVDPTITSIPYVESFDGTAFAPIGWKNTKTEGTGVPGVWDRVTSGSSPTTSPKSGPAMARFNSYSFAAGTKAELITPPINLPAGNFRVSFWMNRDAGFPTSADKVNVYFNTANNLTNATLLGTVHRSMSLEPVALTAGWYAYSYYLPENATGNGRYIILEAVSAYGNDIYIDDFSISSPMVVSHTASNLSCFESNDGSIALNIQGGIPPLTITWKKDNVLMESTSLVLEQLSAAVYEYSVKEATGISVTELVTLTQPAAIPVATVTNTTFTYDGTVKTLNAVAPAGTTLVWYTQAEGGTAVAAPAKTDVGVYNYWVAAKSNTTNCQSLRVGAVLTINKKSLTVKADDKSKCQFTDLPLLTLTYTGFVPGEGPAQLTTIPVATTTALPNSPIGTYPITVGGGASNNYSFVYQSGALTVVRTPMVSAGGPGFVCVSEVFPIVAATATNYTSLVWSTSGNGTFSNATILNPVYTPGSIDIANGSAVLTLTADPGSYCSNFDQMVLNIQNDLPVSVSITQVDTEICLAEPVTFNAVPVNGGLAPVFQWKVNGQNSGSNSSIFTYLPSDGDVVTVLLTTSISCALNNTALSNSIAVDVTPNLIAGVMISTPSNAVCDFTPTTFTASPVNGGVSPAYQWKVNGNNVGTNAAQFTYVPLNSDLVSVVLTSSHSCAVVPVANSNVITMSVAPPFLELAANPTKGGTVSGGGNYPDGTDVTITATAAAGWEFLNWRDMNGSIVSTDAVTIHTIHECYEKLTATFSSTAKIAGQLKYFNNDETIIPSPNNNGVFYVQLFENGVALSPRQLVAHSLEVGLDSYYEFTGVESGKDYSIRIWEEAANGTLASTWSWNNWGGATAADAFIISWMANMDPQLAVFPWIWPAGATQLTPYSLELADVNNNQMIANSDALAVLYRLLAEPGSLPFVGGAHNFALATTKLDDHLAKAHPVAPEKLFTQHGVYTAAASAPSVYQEVLLANVSDGLNIYNIYFTATGDLNTSYTPESENKQLAMLEYNGVINTIKGDEIMIPVRISQAAELGSITLGLSYNNNVIEVLDVIGYDLYNIDHSNGTVKIAWYDLNGKFFANDQHLVLLKARLTGEISAGTRYLELLPVTELSDGNAMQLQNVTLKTDYIETVSGSISDPGLLSISHGIYPNPFNSVATIQYTLPESGKVRMAVYNQFGQLVKMLTDQVLQAGAHQVTVSNDDLNGAGTYFYQITLESDTNVNSVRGTIVLTK